MGTYLGWGIEYMTELDGSKYRYGFASGNVYRFENGSGLEVRNLQSGLWEPSASPLLIKFIFGKGVLSGGSVEADKIFSAMQELLKKTNHFLEH